MTALTIWLNTGNVDSALGESGIDWTQMDPTNDTLIFSNGSDVVNDGQPVPTQSELIQAGIVLNGTQQIVDRYFLADASANQLKEIFLMGNTTSQYVMAFDFDDATASEPVLEIWDDTTLQTIDSTTLGAGTPSNSWWKGITTTYSAPSTDWTGSPLAGSGDNHFLFLNDSDGPLAEAMTLYCNLKIIIPASSSTGTSSAPVIVIKYASN